MRRTARLLSAMPLAAAIGLTSAAAVQAAAAPSAVPRAAPAAASGWRIVASYPAASSVRGLAAAGPDSAWAAQECRKPCASANGVILRHWNGTTWSVVPQSAAEVKHAGDDIPLLAAAPGSPDLWAVYGEYDKTGRASAVEWTGKSWAAPTLFPEKSDVFGFVAGRAGVWITGTDDFSGSFAYRYNGKAWVKAPLPGDGVNGWTLAAGPGGAVWAMSFNDKDAGLAISRWDGERWVAQRLPAAPKGQAGTANDPGGLTAGGPASVWGYGYFEFAGDGSGESWLVHFNGKTWSNVKVPYRLNGNVIAGPVGSDGRGGTWFEAAPYGTTRASLYHVTAAGQWRRDAIPVLKGTSGTEIAGFAPVPGTASVYAYGFAFADGPGATRGLILKYTA